MLAESMRVDLLNRAKRDTFIVCRVNARRSIKPSEARRDTFNVGRVNARKSIKPSEAKHDTFIVGRVNAHRSIKLREAQHFYCWPSQTFFIFAYCVVHALIHLAL